MAREKETTEIPILGIDQRPLERQATPGLCSDIRNLRPYGPEEDPHWQPVPAADELPYGAHTDSNGSFAFKEYILLLTTDHTLKAIGEDPAGGNVLASLPIPAGGTDITDATFESFGDFVVISVSRNSVPFKTYYFTDQDNPKFVESQFPDPPVVKAFSGLTEQSYTDTEIDAGTYRGLRTGRYWWRYAWRLKSGNHVMHSQPFPIVCRDNATNGETQFGRLRFYFEGYQQLTPPADLEFFKNFIEGVTVFLGGEFFDIPSFNPPDELDGLLFYEVARFDYIDENIKAADRFKDFKGRSDEISTNPLQEVEFDSFHHKSGRATLDYNGRLMIGNTGLDFWRPVPHPFNYSWYNLILARETGGTGFEVRILTTAGSRSMALNPDDLSVSGTNVSDLQTAGGFAEDVVITGTHGSGDYSVTVEHLESNGGRPFAVTIDQDDFTAGGDQHIPQEGNLIPYSKFSEPAATKRYVRLGAVVETEDASTFERLTPQARPVYPEMDVAGDPWHPWAGYLWYPDQRAKKITVFTSGDQAGTASSKASGTITVTKGSDALVSSLDTYVVSLDAGTADEETISVDVSSDQTPSQVATTVKNAINSQSSTYSATASGPDVTITATSNGASQNGDITTTPGNTAITSSDNELTGGVDNSDPGSKASGSITVTSGADSSKIGSSAEVTAKVSGPDSKSSDYNIQIDFDGQVVTGTTTLSSGSSEADIAAEIAGIINNSFSGWSATTEADGSGNTNVVVSSDNYGSQYNDITLSINYVVDGGVTAPQNITYPNGSSTSGGTDSTIDDYIVTLAGEQISATIKGSSISEVVFDVSTAISNQSSNYNVTSTSSDTINLEAKNVGTQYNGDITKTAGNTTISATDTELTGGTDKVADGSKASGVLTITSGSAVVVGKASTSDEITLDATHSSGSDFKVRVDFYGQSVEGPLVSGPLSPSQIASEIKTLMEGNATIDADWNVDVTSTTDGQRVTVTSRAGGTTWNGETLDVFFVDSSNNIFATSDVNFDDTSGGDSSAIDDLQVSLDGEQVAAGVAEGSPPADVATAIAGAIDGQSSNYGASVSADTVTVTAASDGNEFNGPISFTYGNTGILATDTDLSGGSSGPREQGSRQARYSKTLNGAIFWNRHLQFGPYPTSSAHGAAADPDALFDNAPVYHQTNRLAASEPHVPVDFRPEHVYYVGGKQNNLRGLAVNALPVSEGQFGQYPVYVFLDDTIWILEQSGDPSVAFGRISPVSNEHGLDHPRTLTNIGRSIIFAYKGRFYLFGRGDPEPISNPVSDFISGAEPAGYYNDGTHEEIWLAAADRTLIYSLRFKRWAALDRTIGGFMRRDGNLVGRHGDGQFYDEETPAPTGPDVPVSLSLEPVHFGHPDVMKRIWALYVRGELATPTLTLGFETSGAGPISGSDLFVRPRAPSDYSFTLAVEGTMSPGAGQYLHRVDAEFDTRYKRRQRATPQS